MKSKILGLLALGLLSGSMSAGAAMIQWNVSGTFQSGATASGTVVWNTVTSDFDNWSILVSGDSSFTAATYSNSVSASAAGATNGSANFNGSTPDPSGSLFFLLFSTDLLSRLGNASSTINFDFLDECRPSCGERRLGTASFTGGQDVSPVPLPAAAWLLLSGLAGLGFLGRRRIVA